MKIICLFVIVLIIVIVLVVVFVFVDLLYYVRGNGLLLYVGGLYNCDVLLLGWQKKVWCCGDCLFWVEVDCCYWVDDYVCYDLCNLGCGQCWVCQFDIEYLLVEIVIGLIIDVLYC